MSSVPTVEELVRSVEAAGGSELDRVGAAVSLADDLGSLADVVVTHFVQAARTSGCSWAQIGAHLGVSKQAAQQAFVAPPRRGRFGRRAQGPGGEPMFGRFHGDIRELVELARTASVDLGHDHVGTEHLLLAVLAQGQATASALGGLGIDLEATRAKVQNALGPKAAPGGRRPFTPRGKKVLALAVRQAAAQHQRLVRSEHVVLALVTEGEGLAAQVMVDLGADLASVRQAMLDLLTEAGPGSRGRTGSD